MRIVVLGSGELGQWDAARGLLRCLGPNDEIIHTGGNGIGFKIDYTVERTKPASARRRLPKVTLCLPETARYGRARAFELNALQLLAHHQPQAVVYVGDGQEDETKAVLALQEQAYPQTIAVWAWEDFVAEQVAR